MNRKEFLTQCGFAFIGLTSTASILQGCGSGGYYAKHKLINNQIVINKSEFNYEVNSMLISRDYILIGNQKFNYPIYIYKLNDERYSALLLRCTHRGCELEPYLDHLACPCHGSEFSKLGEVLKSPAEQNLKTFKTITDNENIYVLL